ncbi:MAG: alpha/beta hydrolase-fold protein, partial [Bacteroidota bacterium]
ILILIIVSFAVKGQDTLVLHHKYLPVDDSVLVYTPSSMNDKSNYPVVFLLHGYGGNYRIWSEISPLQEYSDAFGFIIVCPDGLSDSWYINSPVNNSSQYSSFFFQQLMPAIQRKYPSDQENYFITGLSMGGYGALRLYADNPAMFRGVSAMSALLDLNEFRSEYGIPDIFGSNSKTLFNQSIQSLLSIYKKSGVHLYLDCGTEDLFYKQHQAFFEMCKKENVNLHFSYRPGGHNRQYWAESLKDHLYYFQYFIR